MRPTLLFSLGLAACQSAPEGAAPNGTTRDSAGVQIVTSTTPAWQEGEGWRVDSVPMTVIGADENDPQQQWRYVETAARRSDGSVAVAIEGSIRLFGADGRFVQLLSRSGNGPGEFRYIAALRTMAGDTLVAQTEFGHRVAHFAPDGTLVREERFEREELSRFGPWHECDSGMLADETRYACKKDPSIPLTATNREDVVDANYSSSPGPGFLRQLFRIWLVTPARDTAFPVGIVSGLEQFGVEIAPGREEFVVHPFYSRSRLASGGNPLRLAIATNPDYRIELWSTAGKLERIIERTGARIAPTAGDAEQARVSMRAQLKYLDEPTRERVLAEVPTPDSLAAVLGLAITPAGELLVQREGFLPSQQASVWDVFDRDGRFLGPIRIPGHMRIIAAGDDHLLMLRRTEDEAWLVEVYRFTRQDDTIP